MVAPALRQNPLIIVQIASANQLNISHTKSRARVRKPEKQLANCSIYF